MINGEKRRKHYWELKSLIQEEEKVYESLKNVVKDARKAVPDSTFSIISEKSMATKVFTKAGSALVLSSPIPIVSDVIGVGMLTIGLLAEYKKRKKLRSLLEEHLYFLSMNTEL